MEFGLFRLEATGVCVCLSLSLTLLEEEIARVLRVRREGRVLRLAPPPNRNETR